MKSEWTPAALAECRRTAFSGSTESPAATDTRREHLATASTVLFSGNKNVETLIQAFQALHPRRWFTGLWLNPDFRKLWGSLTIVHFGGQITFLALPLTAAIALNASPFE